MSLKINIETNFAHLDDLMTDIGDKDIVNAARAALNNAVRRGRVVGTKYIQRRRLNLKSTEMKKRINIERARGGNLRSLEAALRFSGLPLSMLHFVVGKKTPINQKGVKVKKRRKLKARVKGSKVVRLQGAFIQDIQSTAVFRHKDKGRRARKLSIKSLAKIAMETQIRNQFDKVVFKRFAREFDRQINWRWSKSYSKFEKKPLKRL